MDEYYSAQICLNGHVISRMTDVLDSESLYCKECGEKSIISCPSCNAQIRGIYKGEFFGSALHNV